MKPKVCVLRTGGTNCDVETAFAFSKVSSQPELVHIKKLITKEKTLDDYQILAIPGGFTYGDDIGAGKILANELKYKLVDQLRRFIAHGKILIGICNGFQVLAKSGLLGDGLDLKQETSLTINDSGNFQDRWVYLKSPQRKSKCVWTKGLPQIICLPVAHGEGKFLTQDKAVLNRLKKNGQIAFQYCDENGSLKGYPDNPNGSEDNIAGICDETGRIFGLMPHPERHVDFLQHPRWMGSKNKKEGDGLQIFKNGVEYVRRHLS